jgi:hypothetical protein
MLIECGLYIQNNVEHGKDDSYFKMIGNWWFTNEKQDIFKSACGVSTADLRKLYK